MANFSHLLERFKELRKLKKGDAYYVEVLEISFEELACLKEELGLRAKKRNYSLIVDTEIKEICKKVNKEKGTIESTATSFFEPKTDIELARLHKVNLSKYVIVNYWTKLLPNGNFTSSLFCKTKTKDDFSAEDILKVLENYKTPLIEIHKELNKNFKEIDVELSISDFHLDKRIINGDNCPINRSDTFCKVAKSLIDNVISNYTIDNIVFPISNDFFHTDNYQNQTTQGTPQDVIMSYDEAYELGFSTLVKTITMLISNSKKVTVVLVQGNHDKTKSFYLAHVLEVYFKNCTDITFLRDSSPLKGLTIGSTFIGWHHGNCKIDDLPLLFATHPIYGKYFGDSKYKEVHTGDKHHYMTKEIKGVRIQQIPSLSGTDRWHNDNNFVHSIRAALILLYDSNLGKIGEYECRI